MKTTTEKPNYEVAHEKAEELFKSLNIQAQISAPIGDVREDWPNILYNVTFSLNGKNLTTEYRLGVGHVKWPKTCEQIPHFIDPWLVPVFNTILHNPGCQLKDKSAYAQAAAWLAKNQKVAPKPYEVLAAICEDGISAHSESFDNYCGNFGMDSDSIKAKRIYETCCELYHKVCALIGADNVQKFAELHAQF